MELKRKCFLLLSLVLISHFVDATDFQDLNQLMDLYGEKGSLKRIQWQSLTNFHSDLKQVSSYPEVSGDMRNKIYEFSREMESVLNNYHRAVDKISASCQYSLRMFPLASQNSAIANRVAQKLKQGFDESKADLQKVAKSLQSAGGALSSIDSEKGLGPRERNILIKEQNDGTLDVSVTGDLYLNDREIDPSGSMCKTLLTSQPGRKTINYGRGLPLAANKAKVMRVLQKMPAGVAVVDNIAQTVNGIIEEIGDGDDDVEIGKHYLRSMNALENKCKYYTIDYQDRPIPKPQEVLQYVSEFP